MHCKPLEFFISLLKDLSVSVTCGYTPSSPSPTKLFAPMLFLYYILRRFHFLVFKLTSFQYHENSWSQLFSCPK